MTTLTAALIEEQRVTFVVALMKDYVLDSQSAAQEPILSVAAFFGLHSDFVVLMGERNRRLRGTRQDLVDFVGSLHPSQLPWKEYRVAA